MLGEFEILENFQGFLHSCYYIYRSPIAGIC